MGNRQWTKRMSPEPDEGLSKVHRYKQNLYLPFMLRFFLFIQAIVLMQTSIAQPKTDSLLSGILRHSEFELMNIVPNDPDTYRLQVVYTEINRDQNNIPAFMNYYFHYDPYQYFNPASMVKMPLAFLALEKINQLNIKGLDKYSTIQFDSSYKGQKIMYSEISSENGLPSIAHFIKRAFLISENDPYNRLYQFVGQQEIKRNLHAKGYPDIRITRQFMGFSEEGNRHTNPVRFLRQDGSLLYSQPGAYNPDPFDFSREIKLGKSHWNSKDSLVEGPFDFTKHNNLSLEDMQQLLQSVIFPGSIPANKRFDLTEDDYEFLYRYLSQYSSETDYPKYDTSVFYDSYAKFFFRNSTGKMPPSVRVFNKVGWSYGFLTDVSYVVDFENKIEYMLSATLYVNSDGVINDGKYDYDAIGYPFLYQLGQTVYQYELSRKRKFTPDLSKFKIQYEKRNPGDTRPSLKDVDN